MIDTNTLGASMYQRDVDFLEAATPKNAGASAGAFKAAQVDDEPCEMTPLLKLAVPVLVGALCQAVLPLTSFVYAGRLTNAAALAGLGLGVSVCNVTGV